VLSALRALQKEIRSAQFHFAVATFQVQQRKRRSYWHLIPTSASWYHPVEHRSFIQSSTLRCLIRLKAASLDTRINQTPAHRCEGHNSKDNSNSGSPFPPSSINSWALYYTFTPHLKRKKGLRFQIAMRTSGFQLVPVSIRHSQAYILGCIRVTFRTVGAGPLPPAPSLQASTQRPLSLIK
jgi:hypothetical protein